MHLTVPIENFKMEAQKLIDENMEYRNVFEKETSREIHDLRNDVNKIDFSGVTESLEFETNIRTDEISKLDAKLVSIKENIKNLEDQIRKFQLSKTTPPNRMFRAKIKELENQIATRDKEIARLQEILQGQKQQIDKLQNADNNVDVLRTNLLSSQTKSSLNGNSGNNKKWIL